MRAEDEDGKPRPKGKETRLQDAVANGNRLDQLRVLRRMLAERFDVAAPRDTAAIARQFQITCDQIVELEGADLNDRTDPLKARRAQWADRLASAANLHSPNLCGQPVRGSYRLPWGSRAPL